MLKRKKGAYIIKSSGLLNSKKINTDVQFIFLFFYFLYSATKLYRLAISSNNYIINNRYWLFTLTFSYLILARHTIFIKRRRKKKFFKRFKFKSVRVLMLKFKKKYKVLFNLGKAAKMYNTINLYVRHKGYKKLKRKLKKFKFRRLRRRFNYMMRRLSRRRPYKRSFNFLKFLNFYRTINNRSYKKLSFSLKRRIFLNDKLIHNIVFNHYYKRPKFILLRKHYLINKSRVLNRSYTRNDYLFKRQNTFLSLYYSKRHRKSVIALNYYKRLLWKIRKSRHTHWSMFKSGKINKWRYISLFNVEVKKEHKWEQFYKLFIFFLLHGSKVSISWRHTLLLEKYQLFTVNGQYSFKNEHHTFNKGDIIEICFGVGLRKWVQYTKILNKRIFYRLKRWGYVTYKNRELGRKHIKKCPKSIKSLNIGYKTISKSVAISRGLGLAAILYKVNINITNPDLSVHKTSIFKLNNWRYRFN